MAGAAELRECQPTCSTNGARLGTFADFGVVKHGCAIEWPRLRIMVIGIVWACGSSCKPRGFVWRSKPTPVVARSLASQIGPQPPRSASTLRLHSVQLTGHRSVAVQPRCLRPTRGRDRSPPAGSSARPPLRRVSPAAGAGSWGCATRTGRCSLGCRQRASVLLFRRHPRLEGVVRFGNGGINGLAVGHAAGQIRNRRQKAAASLAGKRLDADGVVLQFQRVTSMGRQISWLRWCHRR